jgi:hypothetical protein
MFGKGRQTELSSTIVAATLHGNKRIFADVRPLGAASPMRAGKTFVFSADPFSARVASCQR